jgi:hypothetical protein
MKWMKILAVLAVVALAGCLSAFADQGVNGWQWEESNRGLIIYKAATLNADYPRFELSYVEQSMPTEWWWGIAMSPDSGLISMAPMETATVICQFGKKPPEKIFIYKNYFPNLSPDEWIMPTNLLQILSYHTITVMMGQGDDLRKPPFVKYHFDLSGLAKTIRMTGLVLGQTDEEMMQTWKETP